jgi:transposase-like protein
MKKGYHGGQEVTMGDLGLSLKELAGQPLELFAREGARLILSVALEEEVTEFLGRGRYQRGQGRAKGYRNGHRGRSLTCGSGEVKVDVPRVAESEEPFSSRLLRAWQRRSQLLEEVIPLLYLEGLSTRDFKRALWPLWGKSGLSRSSISRANRELKRAFKAWRQRDLSEEEIVYLFLDAFYLGLRRGSREKEGVLVVHGIDRKGQRVLLAVALGGRESTESWKGVLHDLVERGLRAPLLVISDGNPGLLRAVSEVWPGVARQRCVVHRLRNVLARVPRRRQGEVKKALHRIFYAPSLEDALAAVDQFVARYGGEFPTATEVLGQHLGECLAFYRFPERHWKTIRTSNVLERALREVRRRTDVIGRFPTETSALMVVFGVLESGRLKWRGLRMGPDNLTAIQEAVKSLDQEPIAVTALEKLLAA